MAMEHAVNNGNYLFITLILNIVLAFFDERQLVKAGYDTSRFRGWIWLVPVYLYQRANATGQNLAYFVVWIITLLLTI
jgi:hypothetical protein